MGRINKAKLKRLSMYIPEDLHNELVKIAQKRQDTITRLVLLAILKYAEWEKKHE
jgi:tartrate dehydratase alpha subunit/fumarate hydratase class I-like protein